MKFLSRPLLLAWLAASALAASRSALDKATLENFVRHLFLWDKEVQVEISDPQPSELQGYLKVEVRASARGAERRETLYISRDGRQVVQAAIYDVGENPFAQTVSLLDPRDSPRWGPDEAPIKIFVFSDFQCAYCRREASVLRDNLAKEFPGQVQVIFKDLPLESIHPWARLAAMTGRCFFKQSNEAFWEYHDWVFAHQDELRPDNFQEKVVGWAQAIGKIDLLQLQRCIAEKETDGEVEASVQQARKLNLNSTPTLFINGRKIASAIDWETLRRILRVELDYRHEMETPCCAVELGTARQGGR